MYGQILMYESIVTITKYTGWGIGLLSGGLVLRCIHDLYVAIEDEEIGFKEALKKMKKRIFAVVIAITSASLVTLFSSYYQ